MNEFFLDASFVIALTVPGDQHHEKASDLKEQIQFSNTRLITTLLSLWKLGTLCLEGNIVMRTQSQ